MKLPQPLAQALKYDRLAHAYLFYGRRPAESSELIVEFFQRLACPQSGQTPCRDCPDCLQIRELSHPDVNVVNPPANMMPGSSGSSTARIGVDQVRDDVIGPASLTSTRAPYTLFWLNDMSRFTTQATNALLKVLEEPPGDSVFVLTARSLGDSLPTIRSRCQWVRFPPEQIEWETTLEACNALWPDETWDDNDQQQWQELLEGKRPSRTIDWSRSTARGFFTWVLLTIHQQHTNQQMAQDPSEQQPVPYRVLPELLDRLWELEQGGSPVFAVNSLLESIHYPKEMSPCQAVI